MDKKNFADFENEEVTITLPLEDGTDMECLVVTVFKAGEHDYIALLPTEEILDKDEGNVLLYRYVTTNEEEGEIQLFDIEDEGEFDIAYDAFDEYLDTLEFEEMDASEAIEAYLDSLEDDEE